MASSHLIAQRLGSPQGEPFFIFHDRYGFHEDAIALSELLEDSKLKIAVRSARTQTKGGSGEVGGFFWYIGPRQSPELSTLGDGLYQVEQLLSDYAALYEDKKFSILGIGEGAYMAVTLCATWPELFSKLILIDGGVPENFEKFPLDNPSLEGITVYLKSSEPDQGILQQTLLEKLGAQVEAFSDLAQIKSI